MYRILLLIIPFGLLANPVELKLNQDIQGFVKDYCVSCHNEKKDKGDIRFDNVSFSISNDTEAQFWQDVLDTLNAGDMPPKKAEKHPTNEKMILALRNLTESLLKARNILSDRGKAITMRRLNQREYANTVKNLFGFTLDHADLPANDPGKQYDTIGSDQYFSAYLFEKYLELGKKISKDTLRWHRTPRQKLTTKIDEPEKQVDRIREKVKERNDRWDELALGIEAGKSWKELGFKDARDLYFYLKFDRERTGIPEAYLKHQYLNKGIYLTGQFGIQKIGISVNADPRATYKVRALAGIHKQPPERRKFIQFEVDGQFFGQPRVQGTNHDPKMLEVTYAPQLGKGFNVNVRERRHHEGYVNFKTYIQNSDPYGVPGSIFVDRLEIEGPFYPEKSFFEKLMLDENNRPVKLTKEYAAEVIDKFAFEAFRRKNPDPEYMAGIHEIFNRHLVEGKKIEEAMIEAMAVIMASPSFLYINENSSEEPGKTLLTQRELAVRLSYLLWSSPPDEILYGLAKEGKLSNPQVLASQVDRMIDDPRSEEFARAFISQWMSLDRYDLIAISKKMYPLYDFALRVAVKDEPREFFKVLLKENLPLTNLIDSDFVVINDSLAQLYDLPPINKPGFHKVSLEKDSARGGILTSAAFLTMGSDGERTSPIIRAALILEKFLHDPSPSPPPNVPQLSEASKKPLPVKEIIKIHQEKPQCASCHAKMDPIGFGLENFDTLGQWRSHEKIGRKNVPVSADGTLPGQQKFSNVQEFKAALMNEKDKLAESIIEGFVSYSLGRSVEFSDQDAIQELLQKTRSKNYQTRELIHALIQHKLFLHK